MPEPKRLRAIPRICWRCCVDESTAARRYWLLQFIRLGGLALVLIGAAIATYRIDAPMAAGAAAMIAGVACFFFVPRTLAKMWKAGRE